MRGGVYIYRTRKPASLIGLARLPFEKVAAVIGAAAVTLDLTGRPWWWAIAFVMLHGRHFAYVGETVDFARRHVQHTIGGGQYRSKQKPWADLEPTRYWIPLPGWKWLLRTVETLVTYLTWPVYNDAKNRWNPRRRTWGQAIRQRKARDRRRLKLSFSPSPVHTMALVILVPLIWGRFYA
jgi:hypothetical protein